LRPQLKRDPLDGGYDHVTSFATIAGAVLILLPIVAGWFVLFRLAPYRRDRGGVLRTIFQWQIHALRPDIYVDEGQHLVRWLWLIAIVTIPWVLVVFLIFFR